MLLYRQDNNYLFYIKYGFDKSTIQKILELLQR